MMPYPYNYNNYGAFNAVPSYNPQGFAPVAPQTPQTMQGGVSAPSGFSCRPVTSKSEAEAAQISFDGTTYYFVDTSNGKIYAKTFNFNDGTAPLVTYVRETVSPPVQYAPAEMVETLRAEVAALKEEIESMKKTKNVVKKNDEYADE